MSEFSTLSDIFGRGAYPVIEKMSEVVVYNVDADDMSCCMFLNGQNYWVKREHSHRWRVMTTEHRWAFGSQWELLAWVGDRL